MSTLGALRFASRRVRSVGPAASVLGGSALTAGECYTLCFLFHYCFLVLSWNNVASPLKSGRESRLCDERVPRKAATT